MRILRTLWRLLKTRQAPQWTTETDPEQPDFQIESLRNPNDRNHLVTVSVGGFKEDGAPYFLIAETVSDWGAPVRTTLKGSIGEARAVGEEWAAEW